MRRTSIQSLGDVAEVVDAFIMAGFFIIQNETLHKFNKISYCRRSISLGMCINHFHGKKEGAGVGAAHVMN